jgi:prepilin-type N-terminal cleavage/methylation domain-containing protein
MHPRALILGGQSGFTLAETAIVLAVLAVVIGALVPSFLSMRVAEQARMTAQNIQTVMRSVAGFVQSAGCVPCPVPAGSSSDGYGNVRGDTSPTPNSCAACTNAVGLLPYRSLGLPESLAKDAYGHWLTYAVDTRLASYVATAPATQLPVSGTNGLCGVTFASSSPLNVRPSTGPNQNNIAVMILSHGANGRGAYRNAPEFDTDRIMRPPISCAGGGDEDCNSRDSVNFVAAQAAQGNNPFDDVYLYLDRNALITYLGNSPCATEWK